MAETTIIAWTSHTANFWLGCVECSEGCRHCYARTLTTNRMGLRVWGPAATTARQPVKGVYANLRKWNRESAVGAPDVRGAGYPHLVFVGSLMDWAEDHPDAEALRPRMWRAIRESQHLEFQLLTKRAERIAECLPPDWGDGYPNVWLGTSIEDLRVAHRADALREIPAVVRFVSYEPALGPLHTMDLTGIDWCIIGGESGPGYRPMDLQWARDMIAACRRAGVTPFFKQSAAIRTEMGITLDGVMVREYPTPRRVAHVGAGRLF